MAKILYVNQPNFVSHVQLLIKHSFILSFNELLIIILQVFFINSIANAIYVNDKTCMNVKFNNLF